MEAPKIGEADDDQDMSTWEEAGHCNSLADNAVDGPAKFDVRVYC